MPQKKREAHSIITSATASYTTKRQKRNPPSKFINKTSYTSRRPSSSSQVKDVYDSELDEFFNGRSDGDGPDPHSSASKDDDWKAIEFGNGSQLDLQDDVSNQFGPVLDDAMEYMHFDDDYCVFEDVEMDDITELEENSDTSAGKEEFHDEEEEEKAEDTVIVGLDSYSKKETARRKKPFRLKKTEREHMELVHSIHLLILTSRYMYVNDNILDNELLQALVLSILPASLVLSTSNREEKGTAGLKKRQRSRIGAVAEAAKSHRGQPLEIAKEVLGWMSNNIIIQDGIRKPDRWEGNSQHKPIVLDTDEEVDCRHDVISLLSDDENDDKCSANNDESDCFELASDITRLNNIWRIFGADEIAQHATVLPLRVTEEVAVYVLVIACRSLGLNARLAVSFDPEPVIVIQKSVDRRIDAVAKKNFGGAIYNCTEEKARDQNKSAYFTALKESLTAIELKEKINQTRHVLRRCWMEVFDPKLKRYVPVDMVTGLCDIPQIVEISRAFQYLKTLPVNMNESSRLFSLRWKWPLAYVAAFSGRTSSSDNRKSYEKGEIADVTARYSSSYEFSLSCRLQASDFGQWWSTLLNNVSAERTANAPTSVPRQLDAAYLQKRLSAQPIPSSEALFRNHPLFCLEKHLGKYQVLRPRDVIAHFKGQPVFPRTAVHTLHSEMRWLQKCRQLKEGEEPAKRVKHSTTQQRRANDSQYYDLYGEWQTVRYRRPYAVAGTVPRNRFGNVYMFDPPLMTPHGCCYVNDPSALKVARLLKLDVAPAMVGWERGRGGRSAPALKGVVCLREHAHALWTEIVRLNQMKVEAAMKRRKQQLRQAWVRLSQRLLIRERIRNSNWNSEMQGQKRVGSHMDGSDASHTHSIEEVFEGRWYERCTTEGCLYKVPFEKL